MPSWRLLAAVGGRHICVRLRPGLRQHLINRKLLTSSYLHVTCRDLLLHVAHLGQPRDDNVEVSVGDRRAGISYRRCDTACSVHGLAKIVVLNYAENVRRIRLPKKRACPSCDVLAVAHSDSPWLMVTGVANKYHLLWGATVNDDFLTNSARTMHARTWMGTLARRQGGRATLTIGLA